jgi:drug/metabolite transporter (DMT)-like permease
MLGFAESPIFSTQTKIQLFVLFNFSSKSTIALTSCLLGVFGLSFGSIFAKFCSLDLTSKGIAFDRLLIAAIVYSLWTGGATIYQRLEFIPVESKLDHPMTSVLLPLAGIFWVMNLASIYWALTQTSVAITTALHNLAPIFTSLGAWWLWGQKFDRRFVLGLSLAIAGIFVLELEEMQISTSRVQGDCFAILSAVLLAVYLLILSYLRARFSPTTIQLWVCSTGALASLPILLLNHEPVFPHSSQAWLAVLSTALVCQFLGHGLLTFSLNSLSSVTVSLVHLLEPVFSTFLAWMIFWENLSFWTGIGFMVLLAGLYLTVLGEMPQDNLWEKSD